MGSGALDGAVVAKRRNDLANPKHQPGCAEVLCNTWHSGNVVVIVVWFVRLRFTGGVGKVSGVCYSTGGVDVG